MTSILSRLTQISAAQWVMILGVLCAISLGGVIARFEWLGLAGMIGLWLGIAFMVILYDRPDWGIHLMVMYSFVIPILGREFYPIQFGIGLEILMILTLAVALFNSKKENWANLNNDLVGLTLMWFIISVLQLANPAGASVLGWVQEIRGAAVHALIIIPLVFVLFNQKKHLDRFIVIVIIFSVFSALNGMRQLYVGLLPGEQTFLRDNAVTHLLWGQMRVFSNFTDAGMFGASQAHIALVTGVLIFGPFKLWQRALFAIATFVLLYGMLISGTRGALFVLVFGAIGAVFLFKNFRVLFLGLLCGALALGILKYTHIGSGNYHIYRLRTALDPKDASLNLRFENQRILRNHLANKPFGEGLGTIGAWGHKYNSHKFVSTIEPDSYWVKVWAMYGIVGLTIWFSMMLYIIGKCCGIVWNIRDPLLRVKLIALCAGTIGIFVSSYGNEVINRIPASLIVYMSWAFIYLAPKWEAQEDLSKKVEPNL
jgi:hypothetical protein